MREIPNGAEGQDSGDGSVQLFVATPQGQSITVRDVDLSTQDVSRLRRAWETHSFSSSPAAFDTNTNDLQSVGGVIKDVLDDNVRFIFAGRDLEDGQPLDRYGLGAGSTVQVLGRLKGGAQLGKVVKGRSQAKKKGQAKPKEYAELQAKYAKIQEIGMARQQAMTAKAELRRRVEQEQKNSKMNQMKIQSQWRKIMRVAKVESLRKSIEILSQNHERDVDRKDAIVQMLDRDLEEADDQFQTALRTHLQNMDKLIDLQDSRLLALEQEFEAELETLQGEFAEERKHIDTQHAAQIQELNDIIAAVEDQEEEREADAKQEHDQHKEEIKNKTREDGKVSPSGAILLSEDVNLEEINILRIMLDTQIEDLEQHFETAHFNYLQNTDQRTTDFKYLTSKDRELSREIETRIRKIERLQSSLHHWRTKITQNVRENAERNKFLTGERNAIQSHFQHLKGRMNKFRAAQAKRLGELTQNTNRVKKKLREQLKMANKILTLAELARKTETEREKVLPFYVSDHTEEVEEEAERIMKADRELDGRKRVALLDKLAIEQEQRRLEAENKDLQNIVNQYLKGISMPEDAVSDANPLLVVNGRVNLSKPDADGIASEARRVAEIDGNHMVSTGRVNNRTGL